MDAAVQCKMCRICMRSASKGMLIGLFEHILQAQCLAKVVSLVGGVEVQQDDELPELCCTQCLREVEAAYKLRTLCQESDAKLRSRLPNTAGVLKKETFSDDELNSQDPEGLTIIGDVLAQKEVETLQQSLSFIPNEALAVKVESFSYDAELNSQNPEKLTSSDEVPAQKEVEELNLIKPDALKHEYEEITIEETRIIDAGYSISEKCSESEISISDDVDENSSNNEELEDDVSESKTSRYKNLRLPKIFDKYPAVKLSCCRCNSSFDTIEELRAHGREKHCDTDLESFTLKERQCDICYEVLMNGKSYDFHKRNVMYNYRCQICDEILITLKQALAHKGIKHSQIIPTADEALICCGCKMQFHSNEALRIHSDKIHLPEKPSADKNKPITCNICYRNYSTKRGLRKHKLGYLERKNYLCKECGKSFRRPSEVRYHEKSHIQSNTGTRTSFVCSQCPNVYPCFKSLQSHFYSHHKPSETYQCNDCDRSFHTKTAFDEHSRSHMVERPYQCETCEKSFRTKWSIDQHTQLHATIRPFSCPHCPATFKRKGYLTAHVTTHTGKKKKKYPCPQCDRQFCSSVAITNHIRAQHDKVTRLKPYVCPFCLKGFTAKCTQIKHVRREHPEQAPENPNEAVLIMK